MIIINSKYSQNSDFQAILTSQKSDLKSITTLLDLSSANTLRDKASNNKRGITFISKVVNSKFKNIFFFHVNEKNKYAYEYQEIGGSIISEALTLKKKSINIFIDTLPAFLLKEDIIKNILIGLVSRNYNFKNYKLVKEEKNVEKINLISSKKSLINKCLKYALNLDAGVTQTRDLVTMPPNILNPGKFVNEIKKLNKIGLKIEIFDENKLVISCASGCLMLEDFSIVPELTKEEEKIYFKIGNKLN